MSEKDFPENDDFDIIAPKPKVKSDPHSASGTGDTASEKPRQKGVEVKTSAEKSSSMRADDIGGVLPSRKKASAPVSANSEKASPQETPARVNEGEAKTASTRDTGAPRQPKVSDVSKKTVIRPVTTEKTIIRPLADFSKTIAGPVAPSAAKSAPKSSPRTPSPNGKQPSEHEKTPFFSGVVKTLIYLGIIIVTSTILSVMGIKIGNDVFALVKEEYTADISVDENSTISEVAEALYDNKIISYPSIFKFYTNLKNNEVVFSPGTYTVSSASSYDQIISQLRKKSVRTIVTLTFPEGMTVDEIVSSLVNAGCGTRENYIEAINNYEYDYDFVKSLDAELAALSPEARAQRKYRLEGYLFPDTYEFYTDSPEYFIIGKFLANFKVRVEEENYERCEELGMSMDEVLTIASMIQKEAKTSDDFYLVSSVFHNRLVSSKFPYLGSDATTIYGLAEPVEKVTADMNNDPENYYSTYVHEGLPPSAICNVGLEAIYAALYPLDSDYYYFSTDSTGIMHYSRTLAEHNATISKG